MLTPELLHVSDPLIRKCESAYYNPSLPFYSYSLQGQWLAADLAAASSPENRTANPWLVVTVHRPPYSSDKSWEDIRLAIEPLLAQYQVLEDDAFWLS